MNATTDPGRPPLLDELKWRGLLHQTTATEETVVKHLSAPGRVAYCGFDPTKDSLTIGNLVPIKLLMHWQRCGHRPIVLMGGGTGLIGDPVGQGRRAPAARAANRSRRTSRLSAASFERFLDFGRARAARSCSTTPTGCRRSSFIEVLRDVGKHFSVNAMIQRDSVRDRLENREQGISYTEFSYMLLQAYDFLHLKRSVGCSVQLAGSDQYGNIVAGIDLIHHTLGASEAARCTESPRRCCWARTARRSARAKKVPST